MAMLAACVLSGASVAAGQAHWKSIDYLVDSFVDVALGSEHEVKRRQVRKWTVPIRYAVIHHVGDADLHGRAVHRQFEHLRALTGHPVAVAESQEKANFLVVMTSEQRLKDDLLRYFGWKSADHREEFFRKTVCLATIVARGGSRIVRAVVIIPADRARARGKLLACVVEEITQALGLPNDSDNIHPSVFKAIFKK